MAKSDASLENEFDNLSKWNKFFFKTITYKDFGEAYVKYPLLHWRLSFFIKSGNLSTECMISMKEFLKDLEQISNLSLGSSRPHGFNRKQLTHHCKWFREKFKALIKDSSDAPPWVDRLAKQLDLIKSQEPTIDSIALPLAQLGMKLGRTDVATAPLITIWEKICELVKRKVRLFNEMGDKAFRSAPLSDAEWQVADLILLYGKPHNLEFEKIVDDDSLYLFDRLQPLVVLFQLVQKYNLEQEHNKSDLRSRWQEALADYNEREVCCKVSLLFMARRWYELKMQVRNRIIRYWTRIKDGKQTNEKYLPAPLHVCIAKQYPHIVSRPVSWKETLQILGLSKSPLQFQGQAEDFNNWDENDQPITNFDEPPDQDDDLILLEDQIETIEVLDDDDCDDDNDESDQLVIDESAFSVESTTEDSNSQNISEKDPKPLVFCPESRESGPNSLPPESNIPLFGLESLNSSQKSFESSSNQHEFGSESRKTQFKHIELISALINTVAKPCSLQSDVSSDSNVTSTKTGEHSQSEVECTRDSGGMAMDFNEGTILGIEALKEIDPENVQATVIFDSEDEDETKCETPIEANNTTDHIDEFNITIDDNTEAITNISHKEEIENTFGRDDESVQREVPTKVKNKQVLKKRKSCFKSRIKFTDNFESDDSDSITYETKKVDIREEEDCKLFDTDDLSTNDIDMKLLKETRVMLVKVDSTQSWQSHSKNNSIDVKYLNLTSEPKIDLKRANNSDTESDSDDNISLKYLSMKKKENSIENTIKNEIGVDGGRRVAKKVELPDIEEVRRVNKSILTAQVAPIFSNRPQQVQSEDVDAIYFYKLTKDTDNESAVSEVALPTDENLGIFIGELRKMKPRKKWYCCTARRQRLLIDASMRLAQRAGRNIANAWTHTHTPRSQNCDCCCLYLFNPPEPQIKAIVLETERIERVLIRLAYEFAIARVKCNTKHIDDRTLERIEKIIKKDLQVGRKTNKDESKPEKSQQQKTIETQPTNETKAQTSDYEEWIRQRNLHTKYFEIAQLNTKKRKSNAQRAMTEVHPQAIGTSEVQNLNSQALTTTSKVYSQTFGTLEVRGLNSNTPTNTSEFNSQTIGTSEDRNLNANTPTTPSEVLSQKISSSEVRSLNSNASTTASEVHSQTIRTSEVRGLHSNAPITILEVSSDTFDLMKGLLTNKSPAQSDTKITDTSEGNSKLIVGEGKEQNRPSVIKVPLARDPRSLLIPKNVQQNLLKVIHLKKNIPETPHFIQLSDNESTKALVEVAASSSGVSTDINFITNRSDVMPIILDVRSCQEIPDRINPMPGKSDDSISTSDYVKGRDPTALRVLCREKGKPFWTLLEDKYVVVSSTFTRKNSPEYFGFDASLKKAVRLIFPPTLNRCDCPPRVKGKCACPPLPPDILNVDSKCYKRMTQEPLRYAQVYFVVPSPAQCRFMLITGKANLFVVCFNTGMVLPIKLVKSRIDQFVGIACTLHEPLTELVKLLNNKAVCKIPTAKDNNWAGREVDRNNVRKRADLALLAHSVNNKNIEIIHIPDDDDDESTKS